VKRYTRPLLKTGASLETSARLNWLIPKKRINESTYGGNNSNKMKNLSLIVLIISHLIFIGVSFILFQFSVAGILGLSLVAPGGIVETRAWSLFIASSIFPFVTIAVIISTWYFYAKKSYKRAMFLNILPLINIICFYLLLSWIPFGY
jgi:hypothetical protein